MNPISAIGALVQIFSLGSTMVNQGVSIHRELRPPQVQAQAQACPYPNKMEVVIAADGTRKLACVQEQPH